MRPVIESDVEMTTRDGVTLVADVYRPEGAGPWPTLLHRTPYDRTDPTLVSAIVADPVRLARQGFAVVVQDVRGRFASGGEIDFAHQEHDDGYDAVEWAAAQPWSDGRVGIYGSSYHSIAALNAVAARPPHLRAALAMIGGADTEASSWPGGTFELGFLTLYSLSQALETVERVGSPELRARLLATLADPQAAVATLPLTDLDPLTDPRLGRAWQERLTHEPGDPHWRRPTVHADPSLVTVPLLQVAAYRDFLSPSMFRLAEALADDPRHRLIAGPWAHSGVYDGHVGARTPPNAPGGVGVWGPLIAAWFDVHLRGGDGGAHPRLGGEPVHYFLGGEDRWVTTTSWPPPGSAREWRLSSGGSARSAAGDGVLVAPTDAGCQRCGSADVECPWCHTADTLRADPRDPFPTHGGAMPAAILGPGGVQDQRAVDHRDDVLVYTCAPLTSPIVVTGQPRLVVHLTSSAPDADVCVTLVDVEPDGFALPVAEGAVRTRYQHGWLSPDEPAEITVALHDTAHTFRAGHRIRVQIAGASYPRRSRNLHTRAVPELGTLDEAVVAEHTVHHDAAHPSRLILRV